ncbi:MAG: winged helix-turn-helix domain-containing protein [Oscillospiraceae bacterium]|nr:winged helix-turn-helix domain-containing protein [Oscillospiraceae bacterium]
MKSLLADYAPKRRTTAEHILTALLENPRITIAKLSADTGIAKRTIQRYLREFQAAGVLKREGSDVRGAWVLQ